MRGNALADPTVVGLLQPFLVTFWYGHRDDEGPDGFSFDGTFAAVISYEPDDPSPRSLRATFEGIYPRNDLARGLVRRFPITAVMESLPATD